jgi:hypothetical protein
MRIILLIAVVGALSPNVSSAQPIPSATSVATYDSVFAQAFSAYDRQDWRALARLSDPAALARFRDYNVALQRMVLDIPAENGGADSPAQRESFERDYQSLVALSAESLFVRSAHEQLDPYFSDSRRPTVERQVLGHTLEGDSLVHVVFRYVARWATKDTKSSEFDSELNVVDVLTLRRSGGRWRPRLNGGLAEPLFPPMTLIHAVSGDVKGAESTDAH